MWIYEDWIECFVDKQVFSLSLPFTPMLPFPCRNRFLWTSSNRVISPRSCCYITCSRRISALSKSLSTTSLKQCIVSNAEPPGSRHSTRLRRRYVTAVARVRLMRIVSILCPWGNPLHWQVETRGCGMSTYVASKRSVTRAVHSAPQNSTLLRFNSSIFQKGVSLRAPLPIVKLWSSNTVATELAAFPDHWMILIPQQFFQFSCFYMWHCTVINFPIAPASVKGARKPGMGWERGLRTKQWARAGTCVSTECVSEQNVSAFRSAMIECRLNGPDGLIWLLYLMVVWCRSKWV